MSLLLGAGGVLGSRLLLKALQTPDEILRFAENYLRIVLVALPASFLYNFYNALLRASGRVRASLGILAVAMLTNLGLDLIFVIQFQAGTAGVAWATLIAQVCAAGCSLIYVFRFLQQLSFHKRDCRMDRNRVALCKPVLGLSFKKDPDSEANSSGQLIIALVLQSGLSPGNKQACEKRSETTWNYRFWTRYRPCIFHCWIN